jgi:hypothetical protein
MSGKLKREQLKGLAAEEKIVSKKPECSERSSI